MDKRRKNPQNAVKMQKTKNAETKKHTSMKNYKLLKIIDLQNKNEQTHKHTNLRTNSRNI